MATSRSRRSCSGRFSRSAATRELTSAGIDRELAGRTDDERASWLDDQERRHDYVLYVGDRGPSAWTSRCVRQADRILLVARADAAPDPARIAARLAAFGLPHDGTRTELVLVQPPDRRTPQGTEAWLSATGLQVHHHVRRGSQPDGERLARFLTGRAVGLVLGGGGARGFAHIGVIRALREAGVPIDAIGGTSMGAVIAAQYAMGCDEAALRTLNRRTWIDANPLKDKTLPVVALLACRRLDRMVTDMFGALEIADLWLPYFCVSADLTHAEVRVHDRGAVGRAVRASMSLPGMAIPIRDGNALLVDGGVLNNVPADVMKKRCGGKVIAVDVTPEKDLAVSGPYPEAASGWNFLLNRKRLELPSILAIIMRTVMLSSAHYRGRVSRDIDLLVAPHDRALRHVRVAPARRDCAGRLRRRAAGARAVARVRIDVKSAAEIREWLRAAIALELRLDPAALDAQRPFAYYGLDSLTAATLSGELGDWLGREIPPDLLVEHPTIDALAERLAAASPTPPHGRLAPSPTAPTTNGRDGSSGRSDSWPAAPCARRAVVEVEGRERIPAAGPALFAVNHLHILDALWMSAVLPSRTRFLVAEEFRTKPVVGRLLDAGRVIYIARGRADREALERAVAVVRGGGAVAIAPEGRLSRTGGLIKGQSGVAYLSSQSGVPVIPVVGVRAGARRRVVDAAVTRQSARPHRRSDRRPGASGDGARTRAPCGRDHESARAVAAPGLPRDLQRAGRAVTRRHRSVPAASVEIASFMSRRPRSISRAACAGENQMVPVKKLPTRVDGATRTIRGDVVAVLDADRRDASQRTAAHRRSATTSSVRVATARCIRNDARLKSELCRGRWRMRGLR